MAVAQHGLLEALWAIQAHEGLTAAQLAAKLGVSAAALSRYRNGGRQPSFEVVQAILKVYPKLVGYLLVSDAPEEAGTVATPRRA